MSITNAWSGRLAPDGAQVKAKVDSNASLAVDVDPAFGSPIIFGPSTPSGNGIAILDAFGLPPNTLHNWRAYDTSGGLVLNGMAPDRAVTPDSSSLDVTGDIDLRVDITPVDWTPATPQMPIGKWQWNNELSYKLRLNPQGTITLQWSETGDSSSNIQIDSNTIPANNGERLAFRAEMDVNNGSGGHDVRFYTAPTIAGPWTQFGTTITTAGTTSIANSAAVLSCGTQTGNDDQPFDGVIHAVQVRDGIGPGQTLVADTVFAFATDGSSSFIDFTGNPWSLVGNASIDGSLPGKFTTLPPTGDVTSFTFAAAGDAGLVPDFPDTTGNALQSNRVSNAPVFETIESHQPRFFIHLGDLHYYNLGQSGFPSATADNYRRAFDDCLLQTRQHSLYRNAPLVYTWDDHDFGPNNSTGSFPGKFNASEAYHEQVPHYDLPDAGGAIYYSFQVGRVLFVVWDTRFYKDDQAEPEGPNKTMIGSAQKQWFEDLISTSDAQAMVIVSSVQWITGSSGGESWGGYATERSELGQMMVDHGWVNKVLFLSADAHTLALDSGANNSWPPGAPAYVLASLDASPSGLAGPYDIGISNARDQWGEIRVTDNGTSITFQTNGYNGDTILFSDTYVVGAEAPEEPSEPPPVEAQPGALPVGITKPIVEWRSFDLVTGRLIAELPEVGGTVSRILGAYTSTGLTVPMPLSGNIALGNILLQATTPGRTLIVAVVNDQPAWGGRVINRTGGSAATLQLATVTLEGYLRRRKVRDHEFNQADEAEIMATLLRDAGDREVAGVGVTGGIGLEIQAPLVGELHDDTYKASDRVSVYDRVRQREDRQTGLEWSIELLWGNDDHTLIRKVAIVAKRIGIASSNPKAIFESTPAPAAGFPSGNSVEYETQEDYTDGRAATWVEAYSSGEGEDQPSSDPAVAIARIENGWPIDEHHFQPSSSIIKKSTLDGYAQEELELLKAGVVVWSLASRWNVTPRLNIDWRIGDDIAWRVDGHRHPDGVSGRGRCIGWDLDPEQGVVTPKLLDPQEGG